jgi:hypothetical protein
MMPRLCAALPLLAWSLAWATTGHAYPEFQRHIQSSSGQVVSCALCHSHPDGPDGSKHGQIGGLSGPELAALAQSRAQLQPGSVVDNPILNDFGDYLVASLGRNRLLALRSTPNLLASAVGADHDQDQDGIADSRELRDGTDPTDPRHGHPALLLAINAQRHWAELALATVATSLALFGLKRLLKFFTATERLRGSPRPGPTSRRPGEPAALAKHVSNH